MRITEYIDYINRKNKPSKKETNEEYTHFSIKYEKVLKNGKEVTQLTKESQKYEDIRKQK